MCHNSRAELLRRLIDTQTIGDWCDPSAAPSDNVVPADLQAQIDLAPLSDRQKRLIEERLKGRTLGDIATDAIFRGVHGQIVTRAYMHNQERRAMAILAPEIRTVDAWLAQFRAERADVFRSRASLVLCGELSYDPNRHGLPLRDVRLWEVCS
ncbi:MAG: hypothetical protein ACJ8C4_09590 [Gemmataceae bacterium]